MARVRYRHLEGRGAVALALVSLGAVVAAGLAAAWHMEASGHHVTGMSNRVVWGTPHVFAIFLIVAASGALNVASMASVFGREAYKSLARLSGLLAISLLSGGLAVLVLDLGRPDRLIVAMTHYNFKSIFAWNVLLYTGFLGIVAAYLWTMFEPRGLAYNHAAGVMALVWRLILTTGTGSIFGFLVAREPYHGAVMAPLFSAMSFALGLAVFMLVLLGAARLARQPVGEALLARLGRLLGIFVAILMAFVAIQHLAGLYVARQHGVERFFLLEGGAYTALFWVGQVLVGGVVPLALLLGRRPQRAAGVAASCVVLGGFAQLYVLVVGGQAFPQAMFPGKDVSSSFFDGVVAAYLPTWPEVLLGLGGVAFALALTVLALRLLPFLPQSLADDEAARGNAGP